MWSRDGCEGKWNFLTALDAFHHPERLRHLIGCPRSSYYLFRLIAYDFYNMEQISFHLWYDFYIDHFNSKLASILLYSIVLHELGYNLIYTYSSRINSTIILTKVSINYAVLSLDISEHSLYTSGTYHNNESINIIGFCVRMHWSII